MMVDEISEDCHNGMNVGGHKVIVCNVINAKYTTQ